MNRKLSLYQQALIEEKRRQLKIFKADFNPKKKYSEQMRALLPKIEWKEKQLEYINAKQFIKWYLGGYKSGKTFTGLSVDIWLAYLNRPYPGILVHPTMDGNEITIIPTIEEICDMNNIHFDVKKMRTKFKVIFKFGMNPKDWGYLILASGDVPKSLKGPKLSFGHLDEPFTQKEEISEIIISRLAEARGTLRMMQYTGTPEPEHMTWGFDIVDKKFEDSKQRYITTVSTREVAEYLAPGYIEEIEKNLSPEKVQTFIDGEYRNLSQGKVYGPFKRDEHVKRISWKDIKKNYNEVEMVLSFDFNVNQMSATLHILWGTNKHQIKEYRIQSRSDTSEICTLIIHRMREDGLLMDGETTFGRSLIITGDAAGRATSSKANKSDYDIIQAIFEKEDIDIVIYVPDANPAVRDRVNYVNMQFQNGTYTISDECAITIRDRELTSWKLGADGFHIDKSKKELTHLSDAADYGLYNTQILTADVEDKIGIYAEYRKR